jgi:tetratricopeptide (TPR) repeat protein
MKAALGALVIVLAAALAYLPALGAGFVYDDHNLENSQLLRGPLSAIWFGATSPDYWPLTYSSFWLQWRIFGTAPAGYHAVGVALHALTAVLLWRALQRLDMPGAWLAGLLFAVHPVTVESVAWISEQKNGLSGALWLSTALAWIAYDARRMPRHLIAALVLFALALLSKISVVIFPVVILGIAWVRRGRIARRDLLDAVPFAVLAVIAGAVNVWFQHRNAMAGGWSSHGGLAERIGGSAWALGSYLESAYFPIRLALVHPPWPVGPSSPWFWAPLAGLTLLLALLWRARAGWGRPPLLALGYHAACVAPVLGFVDMAYLKKVAPVSNHLQYLALMGPVALAGWGLARLRMRAPRPASVASAAITLALGATTFHRSAAFQDDLSLWEAAVRDAPESAVAHQALGDSLLDRDRMKEGFAELARAAALSTDPGVRHGIRATLLLAEGRSDEAAAEARQAVAATEAPGVVSDAAWTLIQAGRADEAIAALTPLLQRAPHASEYAYRLSVALARAGRTSEAADLLLAWCREHPGHPRMEPPLALLLVRQGREREARAHAAEVLGLGPEDPRVELQVRAWYAEAMGASPASGR